MHSTLVLTFCTALFFTATISGMKLESPLELADNPFDIDPYALAARGETAAIKKLAINELISLDEQRESDGRTIAHIAAATNNAELIQFLLAHEVNFNKQDIAGNTPLHCAFLSGSLAAAQIIVNTQCEHFLTDGTMVLLDISLRNDHEENVLECAISYQIHNYRRLRALLGKEGNCLCASIGFDGEKKAIQFKQNDTNHPLFHTRVNSGNEWCIEHGGHRYCLIFPREISTKSWYTSSAKQIKAHQGDFWTYVNPLELVDIIGKLKWLTKKQQAVATAEDSSAADPMVEEPSESSEAMETPVTPTPIDGDYAAAETALNELRSSLTDRLAALYEDAQCERAACVTIHKVFVGQPIDGTDGAL